MQHYTEVMMTICRNNHDSTVIEVEKNQLVIYLCVKLLMKKIIRMIIVDDVGIGR